MAARDNGIEPMPAIDDGTEPMPASDDGIELVVPMAARDVGIELASDIGIVAVAEGRGGNGRVAVN